MYSQGQKAHVTEVGKLKSPYKGLPCEEKGQKL
jgi:hypothetical protein